MKETKLFKLLNIATLLVVLSVVFISNQKVSAISYSDFSAGNIISDGVFTNKMSMSASQIQTFLNSKVPTCDTNGQQLSEYGGPDLNSDGKVQRWEWGKANYNQTVFTCLKDYQEGGKSSAQIIYDTSQEFNINPQVLIVLLQKEQALVTDTWPLSLQYRSATGYGCPDTAACDTQYYGFTNQVRWAATMYKAIMTDSPTWYTRYEMGVNLIQYNPTSSCGGSNVDIKNRATKALYNYTPYQPNSATLAWKFDGAAYPSCGAFGNLNFFVYFTEWFGSTQGVRIIPVPYDSTTDNTGESALVGFKLSTKPSAPVTIIFKATSPSNGVVTGKDTIIFDDKNWNNPDINTIRVKGINNGGLTGSFRYWLTPWSVSSKDIRYNNLASLFRGNASILHQDAYSPPTVYRLASVEQNKYLFTSSEIEKTDKISEGWVDQGVGFYYCRDGEKLVQRMYDGTERRLAVEGTPAYTALVENGYKIETPVFTVSSIGTVPIYWLYDSTNQRSIYSINSTEGSSNGFVNQGIAFYGCDNNNQKTIYRLVDGDTGNRLYTLSVSERDRAMYSLGFTYEGLSFYACSTNDKPVYRLVSKKNGDRLYTASFSEKNRAVSQYDYRDEGVAFYIQ